MNDDFYPDTPVRKVRTLQELYETTQVVADPNSVSETGPYHDNMPDTSYTEVPKTTSDTPVSQSVPSSPCGIGYFLLLLPLLC